LKCNYYINISEGNDTGKGWREKGALDPSNSPLTWKVSIELKTVRYSAVEVHE